MDIQCLRHATGQAYMEDPSNTNSRMITPTPRSDSTAPSLPATPRRSSVVKQGLQPGPWSGQCRTEVSGGVMPGGIPSARKLAHMANPLLKSKDTVLRGSSPAGNWTVRTLGDTADVAETISNVSEAWASRRTQGWGQRSIPGDDDSVGARAYYNHDAERAARASNRRATEPAWEPSPHEMGETFAFKHYEAPPTVPRMMVPTPQLATTLKRTGSMKGFGDCSEPVWANQTTRSIKRSMRCVCRVNGCALVAVNHQRTLVCPQRCQWEPGKAWSGLACPASNIAEPAVLAAAAASVASRTFREQQCGVRFDDPHVLRVVTVHSLLCQPGVARNRRPGRCRRPRPQLRFRFLCTCTFVRVVLCLLQLTACAWLQMPEPDRFTTTSKTLFSKDAAVVNHGSITRQMVRKECHGSTRRCVGMYGRWRSQLMIGCMLQAQQRKAKRRARSQTLDAQKSRLRHSIHTQEKHARQADRTRVHTKSKQRLRYLEHLEEVEESRQIVPAALALDGSGEPSRRNESSGWFEHTIC